VGNKHNKRNKHEYNLDRLDSMITVALIANQRYIYVPKRLYKVAKQMLAVQNIKDLTIKTY